MHHLTATDARLDMVVQMQVRPRIITARSVPLVNILRVLEMQLAHHALLVIRQQPAQLYLITTPLPTVTFVRPVHTMHLLLVRTALVTAMGMQVVPCAKQENTKLLFSKLPALRATSATPPVVAMSAITTHRWIATRAPRRTQEA